MIELDTIVRRSQGDDLRVIEARQVRQANHKRPSHTFRVLAWVAVAAVLSYLAWKFAAWAFHQ